MFSKYLLTELMYTVLIFSFPFAFGSYCCSIGEGNGNPLQCSCLENPRDGGAWWAAVYGVTQSRTWLKHLSSSSSSCSLNISFHYWGPGWFLPLQLIFDAPLENIALSEHHFTSLQLLSRVRLFATPRIAARQASLSITNSRSSLRLTSIESMMPSSRLILCRALLLLPPIPPSIRVFSNESTLRMRWQKYWTFSFSIIPSKEIPGLISFRMDWLALIIFKLYWFIK